MSLHRENSAAVQSYLSSSALEASTAPKTLELKFHSNSDPKSRDPSTVVLLELPSGHISLETERSSVKSTPPGDYTFISASDARKPSTKSTVPFTHTQIEKSGRTKSQSSESQVKAEENERAVIDRRGGARLEGYEAMIIPMLSDDLAKAQDTIKAYQDALCALSVVLPAIGAEEPITDTTPSERDKYFDFSKLLGLQLFWQWEVYDKLGWRRDKTLKQRELMDQVRRERDSFVRVAGFWREAKCDNDDVRECIKQLVETLGKMDLKWKGKSRL